MIFSWLLNRFFHLIVIARVNNLTHHTAAQRTLHYKTQRTWLNKKKQCRKCFNKQQKAFYCLYKTCKNKPGLCSGKYFNSWAILALCLSRQLYYFTQGYKLINLIFLPFLSDVFLAIFKMDELIFMKLCRYQLIWIDQGRVRLAI